MRFLFGVFSLLTIFGFSKSKDIETFDYEEFKSHYDISDSTVSNHLQGKTILIEFWASWCLPCRVKNGELNNIYSQYHKNGFEVISVALDSDSTTWRKAIRNDKLLWHNQLIDTSKWNSDFIKKSKIYYLPNNILIDSNGVVLGRELYGQDLENHLKAALRIKE
jgi:thiol-disulfide isomerase/thioredoxin